MSRYAYIIVVLLFATSTNAQNEKISIGLYSALDLNFYKFFDDKFRDDEGKLRPKTGFSLGGNIEFSVSEKSTINIGYHSAKQKYFPERRFSFGMLSEVEIEVAEIPINIKVNLPTNKLKGKYYTYFMAGLIFQIEKTKEWRVVDVSKEFFTPKPRNYLIPSLSYGINYRFSERISARGQVSYHPGKCQCEFLSRAIGRINIGFLIMATLK